MISRLDNSHQSPGNRRHGLSLVSCIWLLAFVSAGLWLLLGPSATDSQKQIAEVSAQPTELASFHQPVDSRYRNIEQIRVGQRVVTPEASSAEGLPTAVDPLTWKKLTLQAKARWEDGTIDDIEVQTLQPSSWLALHQAVVGASVSIPLDLREMGLPQMNATVMAIDPCPAIEEGPGRVVLTTVNHLNRFLFDLTVHGKRGPPQAVEVTGWHKLYSEDRQAWTSVCELQVGEVLRGRDGELTVASLNRHPGVQRVYNLTVEEEHQYYVSTADLLAHNANCIPNLRDAALQIHGAIRETNPIRFSNSAVAVHAIETETGLEIRAATSAGRFSSEQLSALEELGIRPVQQPYMKGVHAEDILLNALKPGETVQGWGISWGGRQLPLPCSVCGPKVNAAGGWIDFFGRSE